MRARECRLRIRRAATLEKQAAAFQLGVACANRIVAPIERRDSRFQHSLCGRMSPACHKPLDLRVQLGRTWIDQHAATICRATFCCFHDVAPFRLGPPNKHAKLSYLERPQLQQRENDAFGRVMRIQNGHRTPGDRAADVGVKLGVIEQRKIDWHEAALSQYASIRKVFNRQNSARQRPGVFEPAHDSRCTRHVGAETFRTLWRSCVEPPRRSDETEIDQRSIGVCADALLGPRLLRRACSGLLDANMNARARGEIDRVSSGVASGACVPTKKAIGNQNGHARHAYLQSARPRKQAGSRVPAPEQCRNFV